MPRLMKTPQERVVEYATSAPLTEVLATLRIAKTIVNARKPETTKDLGGTPLKKTNKSKTPTEQGSKLGLGNYQVSAALTGMKAGD